MENKNILIMKYRHFDVVSALLTIFGWYIAYPFFYIIIKIFNIMKKTCFEME